MEIKLHCEINTKLHSWLGGIKHFPRLNGVCVWCLLCTGADALRVETPGGHLEWRFSDTLFYLQPLAHSGISHCEYGSGQKMFWMFSTTENKIPAGSCETVPTVLFLKYFGIYEECEQILIIFY